MKLIGILSRPYYNKDDQKINQVNDEIRRVFTKYNDVTYISILPTDENFSIDIVPGEDKIDYDKLNYVLDKCDGFILPGGSDFFNIDDYVIKYAAENDKPLLGICCGFQALCSYYAKERINFEMVREIDSPLHSNEPYVYSHKNNIKDNTILKQILDKDTIEVNSCHKCIVDYDMNGLIVNAVSEDGVIEGVENPNKKFIMGLEWHPEYIKDENSYKIFDYFVSKL